MELLSARNAHPGQGCVRHVQLIVDNDSLTTEENRSFSLIIANRCRRCTKITAFFCSKVAVVHKP